MEDGGFPRGGGGLGVEEVACFMRLYFDSYILISIYFILTDILMQNQNLNMLVRGLRGIADGGMAAQYTSAAASREGGTVGLHPDEDSATQYEPEEWESVSDLYGTEKESRPGSKPQFAPAHEWSDN